MDRLAFIIEQVEEWRRRDPEMLDRRGFIKHLNESEYYNYPIRDMKIWLSYYNSAKKMRITVPELIFVKISKTRVVDGMVTKRELVTVEVITYDQLKELEEISEVLKKDDPLRKKE